MTVPESVPDLVVAAQARVAEAVDAAAIEVVVVDIFTVFEARMQHHFRRGPFSRKLRAKLLEAGHADLAGRLHEYYLAVNVLKHGKGASYRELLAMPSSMIVVTSGEDGGTRVDVTVPGFFDGLAATIAEAVQFLEAE